MTRPGSRTSTRGRRAARWKSASALIPIPGQITPPAYSPLRVTTSKVVAVPKSTTITGPAVGRERGHAVHDAVGAHVARRLVQDRHARLHPGPDHERLGPR